MPCIQIGLQWPEKLVGSHDFQLHHRFQQDDSRFGQQLVHRVGDRRMQCHLGRLTFPRFHLKQDNSHIHQRIPQRSAAGQFIVQRLHQCLVESRSQSRLFESDFQLRRTLIVGPFDRQSHPSKLSHSGRGPLKLAGHLGTLPNRLAVADSRLVHPHHQAEIPLHPVANHLQVQLAHPADDRLPRVFGYSCGESGILSSQPLERLGQLLSLGTRVWLDRHRYHRLGKLDRLEQHRFAGVAECIAGDGHLGPNHSNNVPGNRPIGLDPLTVVRLHSPDLVDQFLVAGTSVNHATATHERTRVDSHKAEVTVSISLDLEHQSTKGCIGVTNPLDPHYLVGNVSLERRLASLPASLFSRQPDRFGRDPDHGRTLQRAGQVGRDRVQQWLHTNAIQGRSTDGRLESSSQCPLTQQPVDLGLRHVIRLDVRLEHVVIKQDESFEQPPTPRFDLLGHLRWHRLDGDLGTVLLRIESQHPTLDQVDHRPKTVARLAQRSLAEWNLHGQRLPPQPIRDLVETPLETSTDTVELVDEADPGDVVTIRLSPNRLALCLNALDGTEDHHRPIQNSQTAFHLGREIDVAGRVDDVDRRLLPTAGDGSRIDCDSATGLVGIEIRDRRAVVDTAQPVRMPAVEQDPLRRRRLARIDVGHDTNVADAANRPHRRRIAARIRLTRQNGQRPCSRRPSGARCHGSSSPYPPC